MSYRERICLALAALLIASATLALGSEDPWLRQCRQQCRARTPAEQEDVRACIRICVEYGGGGGANTEEESFSSNPYVFEEQHFFTGMKSEYGRFRVLQKFGNRSELLRGIENFRVGIFETQPHTFVVPNHWDADFLIFVANGRGTYSLIHQEKTESLNIKEGDIIRIRAGTTSYLINRDNRETLVLVELYQPVNTPGDFEGFVEAGGENRDSYINAFSNEILEAAFNVNSDRIQRLFGEHRHGAIIKASEEQIRSLSRHAQGGIWPFGGGSKGSYNLYHRRPNFSNQFGRYYEVDATQFRQLQDINVIVSLANISQGAMMAPYYNSKATEINVVVNGEGYFEMACPHLSWSQSRKTGYEKVRSRLSVGTVFIVPAGHPFVAVASSDRNLQILSFKVNAEDNKEFNLAGRKNVMNAIEREAKQLAFGLPGREVEEVFGSQPEEFFFRGPRQGRSQE